MKTTQFLSTILFITIVTSFCIASGEKNNTTDTGFQHKTNLNELNVRYKHFLDTVTYIATNDELKIFKSLPTIRDREVFMNFFWQHRDPTPATPENEYKEEIETRFAYVNRMFGRGTPLPGWRTDRGKIYMILGKPDTIETLDHEKGVYPARIWSYHGDKSLGLPTYFNIVFFKRRGTGDWVLYNQVADGPAALLIQGDMVSLKDYRALYKDLQKLSPSLANPAITMIPGEVPYNYRPSPMNNLIMANIYKSPAKKLNVDYANHFMKYKGYVNVETSINYIENAATVSILRHMDRENPFLHFSIKPKKLSLDFIQQKNQYYYNFQVVTTLLKEERTIYEYTKDFYQYVDAQNLPVLKAGGVVLHDAFPVIPGNYTIRIFLRNKVGKEFSYFEKKIDIPTPTAPTYLSEPLPAYNKQNDDGEFFCAFRVNGERLSVDPEKTFAIGEKPLILMGLYNLDAKTWETGTLKWELNSQRETAPYKKEGAISLKDQKYYKNMNILLTIPEDKLNPNYYDFTVRLTDEAGVTKDSKEVVFMVSPFKDASRPTENFTRIKTDNPFYFHYIIGLQYHNMGQKEKAADYFLKSATAKPEFEDALVALLHNQMEQGKYTDVLTRVDELAKFENQAFTYHALKGEALLGLQKYNEALQLFLEANKIYNSDVRLINLMGMTFVKLNNHPEALKAFEASLKLNPKQPVVEQTIQRLKREMTAK